MYKVIMVSPGGVKHDLQGGFNSAIDAENYARENNWEYCDENGFVWDLDVVDDDPITANLIIPNKQWAKAFLEFRTHGDDQALLYLSDAFENAFNRYQRLQYTAIRNLVDSLIPLNKIVALMEMDEIPTDSVIEESYRNLMQRLIEIADESQAIV